MCAKRGANSGSSGYQGPDVMKTLTAIALALAAAAAPATAAQAQEPPPLPPPVKPDRFQMPSKNIGCLYAPAGPGRAAYLRCDILSGVKPKPRGSCQLDWTGFTMVANARARPTCAGDTVYARRARILRYGSTWRQGGFVCRSRRSDLRCTNAAGRGFSLARPRSFAF
jgi:hypothetical protein